MKKLTASLVVLILILNACNFINTTSYPSEEKLDLSNCDNIEENYQDLNTIRKKAECYTNIAVTNKDLDICEKAKNYSVIGENVLSKCYGLIAVGTANFNICEKIEDNSDKGKCYGYIAINKKDISFCDNLTDYDAQGDCYTLFAEDTQDVDVCEKISGKAFGEKEWCYYYVAIATQDLSICNKISISYLTNECYNKIEPCESKLNQQEKDECYFNRAKGVKTPLVCEKILNENTKMECLRFVADALLHPN